MSCESAVSTESRPKRFSLANVVVLGFVAGSAVVMARGIDFARILEGLKRADWRLVALSALIHLTVNSAARVARWAALLDPLPRSGSGARLGELTVLYFAAQAATNLLPVQAGEALRAVQLHRRHGYAMTTLVTMQIVETVVGAITLGALALLVVPLPQTPPALRAALLAFVALGPGVGLALLWLVGRAPLAAMPPSSARGVKGMKRVTGRARDMLARVTEAAHSVRSPRVLARSLGWSLVGDVADIVAIGLVMQAVGIRCSPLTCIVAFVTITLVMALPTTPAQLGVLEVGTLGALRAVGVDDAEALAFALIYHAASVLPITLLGGVLMVQLDLRPRDIGALRRERESANASRRNAT